jgi:hypothetical protein
MKWIANHNVGDLIFYHPQFAQSLKLNYIIWIHLNFHETKSHTPNFHETKTLVLMI